MENCCSMSEAITRKSSFPSPLGECTVLMYCLKQIFKASMIWRTWDSTYMIRMSCSKGIGYIRQFRCNLRLVWYLWWVKNCAHRHRLVETFKPLGVKLIDLCNFVITYHNNLKGELRMTTNCAKGWIVWASNMQ